MRKTFVGVITAVMVLSIGATSAFAVGSGTGRNYADADGDGVCDRVCSYVDTDNDGVCDNRDACSASAIAGTGHGRHFVDADGDGVCDHHAAGHGGGRERRNNRQGGCSQ